MGYLGVKRRSINMRGWGKVLQVEVMASFLVTKLIFQRVLSLADVAQQYLHAYSCLGAPTD